MPGLKWINVDRRVAQVGMVFGQNSYFATYFILTMQGICEVSTFLAFIYWHCNNLDGLLAAALTPYKMYHISLNVPVCVPLNLNPGHEKQTTFYTWRSWPGYWMPNVYKYIFNLREIPNVDGFALAWYDIFPGVQMLVVYLLHES